MVRKKPSPVVLFSNMTARKNPNARLSRLPTANIARLCNEVCHRLSLNNRKYCFRPTNVMSGKILLAVKDMTIDQITEPK